MVIVFDAHAAVTPAGKPVGVPMPVAPVVAMVIAGLIAVLIHKVGEDDGRAAVFVGAIVAVLTTCAEGPLQPPAVTCISTEPENPLVHVITPVTASIEPAAALFIDQLKPVLLVAVVA